MGRLRNYRTAPRRWSPASVGPVQQLDLGRVDLMHARELCDVLDVVQLGRLRSVMMVLSEVF